MENDLEKAMSKLSKMLSTDDGKKELEGLMSAFAGSAPQEQGSSMPDFDPGMLLNIKNAFDQFKNTNDPRTNLLNALKPYLSKSRHNHVDNAIRIMSLGRMPGVIKVLTKQ